MRSWINSASGSGGSGLKLIKALNVTADTTVSIPANYTILNCVVVEEQRAITGIPDVSMGIVAPNYDEYVPSQQAVDVSGDNNTLLIDRTPNAAITLTIHSAAWHGEYSFYFNLTKFV